MGGTAPAPELVKIGPSRRTSIIAGVAGWGPVAVLVAGVAFVLLARAPLWWLLIALLVVTPVVAGVLGLAARLLLRDEPPVRHIIFQADGLWEHRAYRTRSRRQSSKRLVERWGLSWDAVAGIGMLARADPAGGPPELFLDVFPAGDADRLVGAQPDLAPILTPEGDRFRVPVGRGWEELPLRFRDALSRFRGELWRGVEGWEAMLERPGRPGGPDGALNR